MLDKNFLEFCKKQLEKERTEKMIHKYIFAAAILGLVYMVVVSFTGCTESTQQTKPEHLHHDFKD